MPSLKKTYSYRHKGWRYPTLDFVLLLHQVALEATEEKFEGVKDGDTGRGMVESAAEAPIKTYDKQDLYPTKFDKVAALGYLIARNKREDDGFRKLERPAPPPSRGKFLWRLTTFYVAVHRYGAPRGP